MNTFYTPASCCPSSLARLLMLISIVLSAAGMNMPPAIKLNSIPKRRNALLKKIFVLLVSIARAGVANAQVTIAGSTGTANVSYTSFTNAAGAFAALKTAGNNNEGDVITI